MKYAILSLTVLMSACVSMDSELQAHLEAEADFARHQYHTQQSEQYSGYDPEHVDDCYYYEEELVCEFE